MPQLPPGVQRRRAAPRPGLAGPAVKDDRRALLLGGTAVLLWSTAATAFKLALAELTVPQLLALAVATSAVVLLAAVLLTGRGAALLDTLRAAPLSLLAMGLLNPVAYYSILLAAYDLLPAQQAQTINYTWAIVLAVLSVPVLGQRLAPRDWLAVLLGYCGVVIIATEGDPLSLHFTRPAGVALALGSTLLWALFWLLAARSRHDPLLALTAQFLLATPAAALLCLLAGAPLPAAGGGLLAAVYVGLFEMGITWLLWSRALRAASNVSRVGNLIFLAPLLSLLFIALVLGERIHPATLLGFALILPGVVLQQRR